MRFILKYFLLGVVFHLFFANTILAQNSFDRFLIQWNDLGVETMKTDGINPVLATRIYLYPNIAAYEAIANEEDFPTLESRLIELENLPKTPKKHNAYIAAVTAYYRVMRHLNYRSDLCDTLYQKQMSQLEKTTSKSDIEVSKAYGSELGNAIIEWSDIDHYKETKGMKRHVVRNDAPDKWIPTPPEYRPALEPHWGKLRPLLIEDFEAFTVPFKLKYSEADTSGFYQLVKEVYDTSLALTADEKHQALFWDDNPDLNNFQGHIPTPRRHINPTAHWMHILGQVLRKEHLPIEKTAEIYAFAAMAFYESNLICWHDKYKYNLVRPVTYIRKFMDEAWLPLLVTPPFPEHTSGHSTCSAACATVLTELLGENYVFTDSTHANTDLGLRSFSSFNEAAMEVSLSRFYGGIHYKTAVLGGTRQGNEIAAEILKKLEINKDEK